MYCELASRVRLRERTETVKTDIGKQSDWPCTVLFAGSPPGDGANCIQQLACLHLLQILPLKKPPRTQHLEFDPTWRHESAQRRPRPLQHLRNRAAMREPVEELLLVI
jgi:hypothetical protein